MAEQVQKEEWPEVVGKTGDEAEAIVKAERPELRVEVMDFLSPCTMDYRLDRVRIFTKDGKVVSPPQTG